MTSPGNVIRANNTLDRALPGGIAETANVGRTFKGRGPLQIAGIGTIRPNGRLLRWLIAE